jgi:dTDP-4-dehydrorhamnose reductase
VMRTLVVGASGLLGRALMRQTGAELVGTAFTRARQTLVPLDARSPEGVLALCRSAEPDVVVNLVAERRPSHWKDPAALRAVNVATASNVAKAASRVGAALLHVSTDYVFPSGGPFDVDAPHAPANLYGQTKSEAERAVRQVCGDAVVVRMPVLYGPVQHADECNLSELTRRITTAAQPLPLDTWAQRRPTHVDDIAHTLNRMVADIDRWLGRSAHLSAGGWHSQYDMGRLIVELLGLDPARIKTTENVAPDRPRRVELLLDADTPHLTRYQSLAQALPTLLDNFLEAQ